tara:strand:+ start:902 stop:1858 length:957 start_codon:yes stop_codon:yes gene_type:complete
MSKARELAELGAVYDSGALSNRNLIINGDFSISQRGDYSSATAISTAKYYLDRWKTDISGVSATIEHDAVDLPNGITTKSAKIAASSSASGYMQLTQPIETQSFMDNRKVTISAYVRSNNANTKIRVEGAVSGNFDGTAHTGGGGWELLKETITVIDSVSAFRAGVIMWNSGAISISSGDFFEIAHFQVEFGTEATPFEQRSFGDELARCERYFQVYADTDYTPVAVGITLTATQARVFLNYRAPMRAPASIDGFSNLIHTDRASYNLAVSSLSRTYGSTNGMVIDVTSSSGATASRVAMLTADVNNSPNYFHVDAEL